MNHIVINWAHILFYEKSETHLTVHLSNSTRIQVYPDPEQSIDFIAEAIEWAMDDQECIFIYNYLIVKDL